MITHVNHIYYRGDIDFCNYKCGYCPFSKRSFDKDVLEKDIINLDKFVNKVINMKNLLSIFFIPYGEGLLYDHYMIAMAKITSLPNIKEVCIQTNNSFSLNKFMKFMDKYNGDIKKITLWCSFHPSQIELDDFIKKAHDLTKNNIRYNIGAVADNNNINQLIQLRENIADDVYVWLNAFDGMKRQYTDDEIYKFLSIDPYFLLELRKPTANISKCSGGTTSIFINSKGVIRPCNQSRIVLGNIYKDYINSKDCMMKKCDCYLAYSNRRDLELLKRFDLSKRTRVIKKNEMPLIFFDIDGTLLNDKGILEEEIIKLLLSLSKNNRLFLNTTLSFKQAYKKLNFIWKLFSGGVFLNGANIRVFRDELNLFYHIDEAKILNALEKKGLKKQKDFFTSYNKDNLCKVTIKFDVDIKLSEQGFSIKKERNLRYITNSNTDKHKAMEFLKKYYLASYDDISFFGNSENDFNSKSKISTYHVSELVKINIKNTD